MPFDMMMAFIMAAELPKGAKHHSHENCKVANQQYFLSHKDAMG
jgi:hypothetical protein